MTEPLAVTALERRAGLLVELDALTVTDANSFVIAGEALKTIADYIREVEAVLGPIVAAAHHAHKVAVDRREALIAPARMLKHRLGLRVAAWEDAERERARVAAEAAHRERERLEREAREQAEAEQRRLQREAEDVRLHEAAALETRGDHEGAARLIAAPVAAPVVTPAPIFLPPPPVSTPKVEGVSFRSTWKWRLTDEARLPRQYLQPNEKAIAAVVRAMGPKALIPGVEVYEERSTSVRTA